VLRCSACGRDSPEGFRFCGFCGGSLQAGPPRTEERRVVTVLFCDLVGFTARSDRADPEDVRATLLPYHARLKQSIEAFGGTLDKFIGDGALGVFGAPTAHEDDPERAVLAALRIQEAMWKMNEEHPGLNLAARIGIATGDAVVAFGTGPQIGESVTGDVVNVASRIQSAAPPGGILVAERTHLATKDRVAYEELEPITVKGKADPLAVWRVVEARVVERSPATGPRGTMFVGREAERAILEEALRRVIGERAAHLVTIVGEPGVGKSRLVAEFRARATAQGNGVQWRRGRCLPYGEGVTFWAVGELVREQVGILESDTPVRREAKLASALGQLIGDPSERAWLRARVAPLVGLEGTPGVDREESFAAWRRFLEAVASTGPLVAVVEDLHWADPAALAFIEGLVGLVGGVPLLVIATTRPELDERHPDWAAPSADSTRIVLPPLTEEETASLVSALLARTGVDAESRALLVERAGGNPLYAEEFVLMLADRGMVDQAGRPSAGLDSLVFPDSVQALIAARLDTLAPERKALLQDASVIGRVFWSGALASLGAREEQAVLRELDELVRRELALRAPASTFAGQIEYSFWHALVRDVAYAQIPRAARAAKHRAAAAWIEAVASDRLSDLAEILVHHTMSALELGRASGSEGIDSVRELEHLCCRFLLLAGTRAMGLDVARAEGHLRRAFDLTPPGHPDRPRIQAGLAEAAFQGGRMEEAEAHYRDAIEGLASQGLIVEAADAMVRLSVIVEYRGNPSEGRTILIEAIRTLEGLPPGPALARALTESAGTLMVAGRYTEAVADAERAIEMARAVGEAAAEARAHNFRGYARVAQGDREGLGELRESVETTRGLGLGRATAVSYSNLGAALLLVEGPGPALECGREGVDFAEARGLLEMATFLRNAMLTPLSALGEWDEVLRMSAEVTEVARRAGALYEEVFAETDRAFVLVCRGEPGAVALAESLLSKARPMGDIPLLGWALTIAALGRLGLGDADGAKPLVEETLDITRGDAIGERASLLPDLVRVALGAGDVPLAGRLIEGVERLPLPRHRYALLSARAAIVEGRGELAEALELYEEAVTRWARFGHALEHGRGLLGAGRCLAALGRADAARERFVAARAIFHRLSARPMVANVDARLAEVSDPGTIAP
jgi:class 3 adenylate cyclase/tetratricopeptide (TPR) repeat protein